MEQEAWPVIFDLAPDRRALVILGLIVLLTGFFKRLRKSSSADFPSPILGVILFFAEWNCAVVKDIRVKKQNLFVSSSRRYRHVNMGWLICRVILYYSLQRAG